MTAVSSHGATPADWVAYDFAVLRAVAHPHLGTFVPVGVVVHARTREFLALRTLHDAAALRARVPDVDADLLARYLAACEAVCTGDDWMTSERGAVIQWKRSDGGASATGPAAGSPRHTASHASR